MIKARVPGFATIIGLAILAGALALAGFWLLFTTFMIYDDEGYVLLSLKNFSVEGGLYDRVYTQYGPFFYLLYDALHRVFGFAFDNTSGRWITLVNWTGASILCSCLVVRVTRSAMWGAFTLAGTFTYLWVMINEPMHPGGLLVLLVSAGTYFCANAWQADRSVRFAVIAGVVGAMLALVKINVGAFFLAATFCWLAVNSASANAGRTLTWLAAFCCALLPFALMRALYSEPWVRMFGTLFIASTLATLLVARRAGRRTVGRGAWVGLAAVFSLVTLVVVVTILGRGSSMQALAEGVLWGPLKHPGVYSFAVNWRIGAGALALLSLVVAGAATHLNWWTHTHFRELTAWGRLAATILFLCSAFQIIPTSLAAWGMCYGVPLAWFFAISLSPKSHDNTSAPWIALVLVFQCLQAYPVAGSQMNWGTFLWVPLLAMGMHDATPILRIRLGRLRRNLSFGAATIIIVVTVAMTLELGRIGYSRYINSRRLELRGAENLRLPNDMTYALRIINENVRAHGNLLFSYPGIFSTNIWTGVPTPTLANVTHWFSLLSPEQQNQIREEMSGDDRSVLLVQRDSANYLKEYDLSAEGRPLFDWLMMNFEKAFSVGGYELWVHQGRSIAPLSIARAERVQEGYLISLTLTLRTPSDAIGRIDLCNVDYPESPLYSFRADNSGVIIVPIGVDGHKLGKGEPGSFPLVLPELASVDLRFAPLKIEGSLDRLVLVARGVDGGTLSELLIVE